MRDTGGIRTREPSNRTAVDIRLRLTATEMLCKIRIAEVPVWKDETALRTVARNMQLSCKTHPRRANVHSVQLKPHFHVQ